jgi:DNA-binding MarR family transcriptional regulator
VARTRPAAPAAALADVGLERALEGLFRLGANRRFSARQAAAVGAVVTRAGYAALRSLSDHGRLGVRELADASAMDAATASRQIQQLVDAGLVSRSAAEDDARASVLSLTPRGSAVYERIVRHRLAYLADVLEGWSEDDRAVLLGLVERLVADLARPRGSLPPASTRVGAPPSQRRRMPRAPRR